MVDAPPPTKRQKASAEAAAAAAPSLQEEIMRAATAPIARGTGRLRRSPVYARHGMVSCSQPLASEAGLRILKSGGNAVDAAIAMAAALNVTTPTMTGLGGDMFMLYWDAKEKAVKALNGSGRSPAALTVEAVREAMGVDPQLHDGGMEYEGTAGVPDTKSIHCVTVPGSCAGWCDAIECWGSKSMADVLQPAIELAAEGYPVAPVCAAMWDAASPSLSKWEHGAAAELLVQPADGSAPRAPGAGEIFTNPALAESLREIATGGKDAFYRGRVAERIVETVRKEGGTLTMDDMAAHSSEFVEALSMEYHGVELWEHPPSGQGITALIAANILRSASTNVVGMEHGSTAHWHTLIEVLRLAFADTRKYVADPTQADVPVGGLLSHEYGSKRAKLINPTAATADVGAGTPLGASDTVSFQVVDGEGNAVSMVNSVYMHFGSGLVAPGTGFVLQNRGANFSLRSGSPNVLAGGKRPFHTIIPAMITKKGELVATFTNMGGFMQPQGHINLLCNLVDFKMDPQAAVDAPRFCILDGTAEGAVSLEEGISDKVIAELKAMGHKVCDASPMQGVGMGAIMTSTFGRAQVIVRDPASGVLCAGSDGRADGCAMGW